MVTHMNRQELYARVGWRKYLDTDHSPRVARFLKSNGLLIFTQLLENIEEAIEEDEPEILIMVHKNANAVVSVGKKDYMEVLEHSMQWFLKNEHYEQCAKIKKIFDNMETPSSLPQIK